MPFGGLIGGRGGGGGTHVGEVKEAGGGRPVPMEEGEAGGGGGKLSLLRLETVGKVGTDGRGTAMP